MPPKVVATKNLPCELRFATPEAYEELLNGSGSTSGSRSGSRSGSDAGLDECSSSTETRAEDEPPVHLFPEGGVTNGRHGMMAFSRGGLYASPGALLHTIHTSHA